MLLSRTVTPGSAWAGSGSVSRISLLAAQVASSDRAMPQSRPASLADVDVVLALRGSWWNGYAQQHWKSNVKLANAHGSGTPFIGAPEDGYLETAAGAEYWATCESDLARALDWLESEQARKSVQQRFLKAALPVEKVAEQYREVLCALRS